MHPLVNSNDILDQETAQVHMDKFVRDIAATDVESALINQKLAMAKKRVRSTTMATINRGSRDKISSKEDDSLISSLFGKKIRATRKALNPPR